MKVKYIVPLCEDIRITEDSSLMLTLSVHSDEETEIVGGKEQTEFEEEDAAPTSPNLWEDEED